MFHSLFVVEGRHDVELIGALLRRYKICRVQKKSEVPDFWKRTIPTVFPYQDDLLKRMPMPTFFANDDYCVGVQTAQGFEGVVTALETVIAGVKGRPDGIGIVVDADDGFEARWTALVTALKGAGYHLGDPAKLEQTGETRIGAFVLPDNQRGGALEKLAIESGQICYPKMTTLATRLVNDALDSGELKGSAKKELESERGKEKAIVGAVANLLRPGRAIQVSYQDNEWFRSDKTRSILTDIEKFVCDVVGLQIAEQVFHKN